MNAPPVVPDRAFGIAVRAKIRGDLEREASEAEALRARVVPAAREAIAAARRDRRCARVWLFGSFAGGVWGQPSEDSDIDLLIEGDEDAVAACVTIATLRPVHGVGLATAPRTLVERCLRDGVPL